MKLLAQDVGAWLPSPAHKTNNWWLLEFAESFKKCFQEQRVTSFIIYNTNTYDSLLAAPAADDWSTMKKQTVSWLWESEERE